MIMKSNTLWEKEEESRFAPTQQKKQQNRSKSIPTSCGLFLINLVIGFYTDFTNSLEQDVHNESQVDESDQSSRRNNVPSKWVVNLYTDSKELGEIWSKATFKNAMTVEMILWARNEQSVELAQLEEGYLKELFAGFGISLEKFVVLNAERPRIEKSLTGQY